MIFLVKGVGPLATGSSPYFPLFSSLTLFFASSLLTGWVDAAKTNAFPHCDSTSWYVGAKEGTFGVASQSGTAGTSGLWRPFIDRKLRKGDIIGTMIDLNRGEIRYWVRSAGGREKAPDLTPSAPAFASIDPRRSYLAAVSLKYAQSSVQANFKHPFALWDLVQAHFQDEATTASLSSGGFVPSSTPALSTPSLSLLRPSSSSLSSSSPPFKIFSSPPASTPFRLICPLYAKHLPLPLASPNHTQSEAHLSKAASHFNENVDSEIPLFSLPLETLVHIFSFLDIGDIPHASIACRTFYEVQARPELWNLLIERDFHFGLGISTSLFYGRISEAKKKLVIEGIGNDGEALELDLDLDLELPSPSSSLPSPPSSSLRLSSSSSSILPSLSSHPLPPSSGESSLRSTQDGESAALHEEEEPLYGDPYSPPSLASLSTLSKERYRKRYNWSNCRYDTMFTIPTDFAVTAMVYDEKTRNLFYSVADEFYVFNFSSGLVSVGLLSTVGHITHLILCNDLLLIATDADTIHVIEPETGTQLVRLQLPTISSLDAYYDTHSDVLAILVGTKRSVLQLWTVEKINRKLLNVRGGPRSDADAPLDAEDVKDPSHNKTSSTLPSNTKQDEAEFATTIIRPSLVWQNTTAHVGPLVSVAWLPHSHGKQFLTASSDGQVHIWKRKRSAEYCASGPSNATHEDGLSDETSSYSSDTESSSSESESATRELKEANPKYDFGEAPFATWTMACRTPDSRLTCLSVSPEGWYAAVSSSTGSVFIFDGRDGSGAVALPVTNFYNSGRKRDVRYTWKLHYECGGKLVTVQDDNSVRFWNQTTGLEEWALQTAGLAGSLLCTEDFLVFGLINGRITFLDFDKVALPEEMASKSLDASLTYFSKFSRHV